MTTIKLDRPAFLAWHETLTDEARIELSSTIMQEFAKKHLKPLENDSAIKSTIAIAISKAEKAASESIQKEIQAQIGTLGESTWIGGKYHQNFTFNPIFKEKLDISLQSIIDTEERKLLRKADELFTQKRIEIQDRFTATLDRRLKAYEDQLEEKMAGHFNALLQKFLKSGTETSEEK